MKILALGHKSRVGKDTLCRFIIKNLRLNTTNLNIQRVSFASQLKKTSFDLYGHLGLKDEAFYEKESNAHYRNILLDKIGMTPVEIWIEVGNKMREVYENTWVDLAFQLSGVDVAIVTDMRFPNEAYKVMELYGKLIRITNPNAPVRDSVSDKALDYWTDWHEDFCNSGSLNELNDFAKLLCEKYIL